MSRHRLTIIYLILSSLGGMITTLALGTSGDQTALAIIGPALISASVFGLVDLNWRHPR